MKSKIRFNDDDGRLTEQFYIFYGFAVLASSVIDIMWGYIDVAVVACVLIFGLFYWFNNR